MDKSLHDAHPLNTLHKTTNKKDKQTKYNKKLKHVNFSLIIFVKLVIPSGKKDRQSKTRIVKALVDSVSNESILAESKVDKISFKRNNREQQWSTSAGVLNTNTKTTTSFSFHKLNYNKLINQSLHIIDLNIDRYDMIIGCD